jgi:serine/threonine protein phosphatase PrpC
VRRLEVNGEPVGPTRVMSDDSCSAGLAMSRSIGDLDLKDHGLTCEPIIRKFELKKLRIQTVVLASDGLWAVMSNKEVSEFMSGNLEPSPATSLCQKA